MGNLPRAFESSQENLRELLLAIASELVGDGRYIENVTGSTSHGYPIAH